MTSLPTLVPTRITADTLITPGDPVIWHVPTETYGCWTSYDYVATSGTYPVKLGDTETLAVDVQLEVDYYRATERRPHAKPPTSVSVDDLWAITAVAAEDYDAEKEGGPIPTQVFAQRFGAFRASTPPVRRLHYALSVAGLTGRRAWIVLRNDDATVRPGYRVVGEPYPLLLVPDPTSESPDDGAGEARIPITTNAFWFGAHDFGRPPDPSYVTPTGSTYISSCPASSVYVE